MQRVRVLEATMAGAIICEIELDDKYSNIMGITFSPFRPASLTSISIS